MSACHSPRLGFRHGFRLGFIGSVSISAESERIAFSPPHVQQIDCFSPHSNLDRWLDAYDEDVDRCIEVITVYMKNRKALGLDRPNAYSGFYERPEMRHFYGIFCQSRPRTDWVNAHDNGLVFVEAGVSDAIKACKVIRAGDFLRCFYVSCEFFLQLVLERERQSGRRSYGVCIFDMQHISILQYVNPMAPINRIFECRVHILMSYYAEMLSKAVIVNPPRLLNALMTIMSILLPARVINRFHIAVHAADVQRWISPDVIPVGFGGERVVEGADLPETGCNFPKEFSKEDFLRDGTIWERHGLVAGVGAVSGAGAVQYEHCVIGVGESYVQCMEARKGQTLLYEFFANRSFECRWENETTGDYLLPRIKMCTPLLAEEGAIPICADGNLRLELKNASRIMRMKLRIALRLIDTSRMEG